MPITRSATVMRVRERIATGLSIGIIPVDFRVENEPDWANRIVYMSDVDLYEASIVQRASDKAAGVTAEDFPPQIEVNGLLTYDREVEKLPVAVLAEAHKKLWQPSTPTTTVTVLATADARIFHRSYGDQHGELWSPSGRLLATTTQIAYFKV